MQIHEREILKKSVFFSKLFGTFSYGSLDMLQRDAKEVGIPIHRRFHRIILAEVETWGELLARGRQDFEPDDRSEANFVLTNICSEAFSIQDKYHVCFSDYQGRIVFWIDAEDDSCATEAFQHAAEYAVRVMESEFSLVVTFSISGWFDNLFQTFDVYQDTLNLLFFFRYLSSRESVYTMEMTAKDYTVLPLSVRISMDRQILDAVQQGNFEGIKGFLQETFRKQFLEGEISLAQFPLQHASFRQLLGATAAELLQRYPVRDIALEPILQTIAQAETAEEQLSAIETMIDGISEKYGSCPQTPSPGWVNVLTEYVKTHYTDPNMTVYQLADFVKLTPSYCTRVFRRYMGMTLLEYIQRQRVQAAIASLEAGETMTKAAQNSGFSNTQTLRRTLKQYHAR